MHSKIDTENFWEITNNFVINKVARNVSYLLNLFAKLVPPPEIIQNP